MRLYQVKDVSSSTSLKTKCSFFVIFIVFVFLFFSNHEKVLAVIE